ncbi:DbpA RNA binding domain-containing protein [Enterococcus termitis]
MKLYFNGGKKKKLRAVDFVGTLTSIDGVKAEDIGIITIQENVTYIDILNGKGAQVIEEMKARTIKGKQLKVHKARKNNKHAKCCDEPRFVTVFNLVQKRNWKKKFKTLIFD